MPLSSYTITSDTQSGISPLEITLSIEGSFDVTATGSFLSYTGPGDIELLSNTGVEYGIRMTTPGLYVFTAEVEYQGTTYSDSLAVLALDEAELDALLKAKWNGMKAALVAGNVEEAVEYFTLHQQQVFREIFTVTQDNLAQMAIEMQEIELVYQKNETAEYRIKRDVMFNGVPETITFYIYFQKGADGIWRIRDF